MEDIAHAYLKKILYQQHENSQQEGYCSVCYISCNCCFYANQSDTYAKMGDAFLLALTLSLFAIPQLVEHVFKIEVPNLLELIIISFIFSSTILGELSDFYGYFKFWDTVLHTLNGFLAAGVGFSLVYLLNKNAKGLTLYL